MALRAAIQGANTTTQLKPPMASAVTSGPSERATPSNSCESYTSTRSSTTPHAPPSRSAYQYPPPLLPDPAARSLSLCATSHQPASEGSSLLRPEDMAMLTHYLSRLLFYRRIFPVREIKLVLQIAMAIVVAYFVGSLLSSVFQW